MIKIRDGVVANRPAYLAVGVDLEGRKHVLGIWIGDSNGEGSKFWLSVFSELKNRGVDDVLIVVCDGLAGLPDAIETIWPQATIQTCVVHLLRGSFRYASYNDRKKLAAGLRPIYTAVSVDAAEEAFEGFEATWDAKYPAIIRLWRNSWDVFVPFLAFPPRDPPSCVYDKHDRIDQLPAPESHPQPGPLPDREGSPQTAVSRHT